MADSQSKDAIFKIAEPGGQMHLAWAYGLCAVFLAWPALYNRFPLVFSDTGSYLTAAIQGSVPTDRPVYYSIFVSIVGLLQSLYAVPVVQGLIVAGVLNVALSAALGPIKTPWLVLAVGLLALLTPLPWLASWLMPDVFAGTLIIAFISLAVYWSRLTAVARLALGMVLLFSAVVATGNLLLLSLMTIGILVGEWVVERKLGKLKTGALVGALLASYCLAALPNYAYHDRFTISPDSNVFLAARLFDSGLMAPYLEQRCPSRPEIPLCPFLDEVRKTSLDEFLWGKESLSERTHARGENLQIYASFVREAMIYSLSGFIVNSLNHARRLLTATSLGEDDGLRSYYGGEDVHEHIKAYFPHLVDEFVLARQQAGTLDAQSFNFLYRVTAYMSYVALAIFVWWWARSGMREFAAAGGLVFLALVLNALIFGSLAEELGRYQVRLAWVAMFFVLAGLLEAAMNPVTRTAFVKGAQTWAVWCLPFYKRRNAWGEDPP